MKNNAEQTKNILLVPFVESIESVVELSDGDSNIVYALDDRYIYKRFKHEKTLLQEAAGYTLFNQLSTFGVPLILDKGSDYLLVEFVSGRSCYKLCYEDQRLSKESIAAKIASFIADVYWNYKYFPKNKIKLFPRMSWATKVQLIITEGEDLFEELATILTPSDLMLFKESVEKVRAVSAQSYSNLTLLHRDLHLDNMLVKSEGHGRDKNVVIDFEHCMEGPVELELQNAIFWDDAWSVPMDVVRRELRLNHAVPYTLDVERQMLPVYFVDQVILAMQDQDLDKVQKLVEIYKERSVINNAS